MRVIKQVVCFSPAGERQVVLEAPAQLVARVIGGHRGKTSPGRTPPARPSPLPTWHGQPLRQHLPSVLAAAAHAVAR